MQKQFLVSIAVALITLGYVSWHFYNPPVSRHIIEGPSNSFTNQLPAQVSKNIIFKKGGKELCTAIDPVTQCEVGVACKKGDPPPQWKSLKEILKIEIEPKISIEGHACATFDIDLNQPENPWRCSGGRCYWVSDRRLKRNIHKIGKLENGLNVYTFNYIWDSALTVGVMADEVRKVKPEAVININGFDLVDYSEILK